MKGEAARSAAEHLQESQKQSSVIPVTLKTSILDVLSWIEAFQALRTFQLISVFMFLTIESVR